MQPKVKCQRWMPSLAAVRPEMEADMRPEVKAQGRTDVEAEVQPEAKALVEHCKSAKGGGREAAINLA